MPDEPLLRVKLAKPSNNASSRIATLTGCGMVQGSAPPVQCATFPLRRTRWNFRRSLRGRVVRRTSMCTTSTFAAIRPGS